MIAAGSCYSNRKFALLTSQARWTQVRIETGKLIEKFIMDIYKKLSIELLVQCGANEPTSAVKFSQIQAGNKSICFEANPYIAKKYMIDNDSQRVRYFNIGLGKNAGKLNFYIPEGHPRDWTLQGTFSPAKHLKYSEFIEIEINSLDNLIPSLLNLDGFPVNSFPKTALLIDVEGFSWEVLQGSKEILNLKTTQVIFIEVQDGNTYWEHEKNGQQISNFLESYGFTPIARDYPTAAIYNIIFVKNSELDLLTDLIDAFWFNFTQIKPSYIEFKDPKILLSKLKALVLFLLPRNLHKSAHKFFATLGSRSSVNHKITS